MRKGFTLAEVLVVSFLALVVLGLMMQLLLPSLWMYRVESARSEAQQACLLAGTRIQQALLNSQMESLYVSYDPPGLAFQEVVEAGQPFDATNGAPLMAPYFRIFWYDRPRRRLMMKVWPPRPGSNNPTLKSAVDFTAPGSQPQRLTYQEDLQAIVAGTNGREQVVARNVERLVISDYGGDVDGDLTVLSPPLEVTIECSVDTSMQGAVTNETFRTTIKAVPRSVRF